MAIQTEQELRERLGKEGFFDRIFSNGISFGYISPFWMMLANTSFRVHNAWEIGTEMLIRYLRQNAQLDRDYLKSNLFSKTDEINRIIAGQLREPVLDAGCGITVLYDHISKMDYTGIDIAVSLFEFASAPEDCLRKLSFWEIEKLNKKFNSIVDCVASKDLARETEPNTFDYNHYLNEKIPELLAAGGEYFFVKPATETKKTNTTRFKPDKHIYTVSEKDIGNYKLIKLTKK